VGQGSVDTQASGSASQSTSVSADKSGAQANSSTSTDVTQSTSMSRRRGDAQASSSSQFHSGSTVQAELIKPVDARKNKPGDEVIAKTTQDMKSEGKVVLQGVENRGQSDASSGTRERSAGVATRDSI